MAIEKTDVVIAGVGALAQLTGLIALGQPAG